MIEINWGKRKMKRTVRILGLGSVLLDLTDTREILTSTEETEKQREFEVRGEEKGNKRTRISQLLSE